MVHAARSVIQLAVASLAAALMLFVSFPQAARAAPCRLADVEPAALETALSRLRAPPPTPAGPGLWRVLLPRRVGVTFRDQSYDGVGWYAGSTGTESERGLFGVTRGYSVQAHWDLAPLWRSAPAPEDPLARIDRLERVASRVAAAAARLKRARIEATELSASDPRCGLLAVTARSALLVMRAAIGRVGVVPAPGQPPTSRSRRPRDGRPAQPPAGLPPRGPSRRR